MGIFAKPRKQNVVMPDDEEVERQRARQRRAAILAQGRQSTIATGAQGVGTSGSNIVRPSTVGVGVGG